jgi:tetratricopeptide (TPR) repeat protein
MIESDNSQARDMRRQFVEAALDDYEHAVVLDPSNGKLQVNLGDALGSLGRHDEALDCYRRAMAIEPRSHVYQAKVALTEVQVGNVDRYA